MKAIYFNIGILLIITLRLSQVQDNAKYSTRTVVVNYNDSTVHSEILTTRLQTSPDIRKVYYWYLPDIISSNRGGFSGNVLHGDYMVYDERNHLIAQGLFSKGLKTGAWKRWDSNGNLLELINWDDGLLDGISAYYDSHGEILRKVNYKDGKLETKNNFLIRGVKKDSKQRLEINIPTSDSISIKTSAENNKSK